MPESRTEPILLDLSPGPFRMWPQGVLRAAGFALDDLVALGDPEYAAAVDAFLDAEAVRAGTAGHAEAAGQALALATTAAMDRQAAMLAGIAGRADFQEAVTWQNHSVVEPMIVGLATAPLAGIRNQRYRKKQRIVAKYWARYCAKNDTIGFFGANCWFRFAGTGPALSVRPGPERTRWREVFFEGWPIDTIAEQIARDPEIRRWVAPRLNPVGYLADDVLLGLGPPHPVAGLELSTLRLCDGVRPACDVVAKLLSEHGLADESVGYRTLQDLVEREWLRWDLEPPLGQRPERLLDQQLDAIADEHVRQRARRPLRVLAAARATVAAAEGPERLRFALGELDRTFLELTGVDPSRRAGQTYGGRRLVYLDCARDLDLVLGPSVLRSFAAPLSVLLYGARWLTHRLAQRLRSALATGYDGLVERTGSEVVGFLELMPVCGEELFTPGHRAVDRLLAEFVALWRRLFRMDTDAARVELTTSQIWAQVGPMFSAAEPGWGYAAQHAVDLQLAAAGVDALAAGEVEPVIAEIHLARNTVASGMFVNTHPDLPELIRLVNACVPPLVVQTPVKNHPRLTTRTATALDNGKDWWLVVSPSPGGDPVRRFSMAELRVQRIDGRLQVRNADGHARFDIIDVLGMWLAADVEEAFKRVTAGRPHSPRVTLDRLVVYRETWTVPVHDMPFLIAKHEHGTFLGARGWIRERGLPRFVFAKLSTEMKPFYVDFASPVQVANLTTELRTALLDDADAVVTFSEMYPTPDQVWLPDVNGQRYTSELRLQFVDSSIPHPA